MAYVCLFNSGLRGEAKFGDTTLKHYSGNLDDTTFGTAVVSCMQKGGELVMPKNTFLNAAVTDVAQSVVYDFGNIYFMSSPYNVFCFLFKRTDRLDRGRRYVRGG